MDVRATTLMRGTGTMPTFEKYGRPYSRSMAVPGLSCVVARPLHTCAVRAPLFLAPNIHTTRHTTGKTKAAPKDGHASETVVLCGEVPGPGLEPGSPKA